MTNEKQTPETALAAFRRENRMHMLVSRAVALLEREIDDNAICGSWLSTQDNLSAIIRRIGTNRYRAMIFDNSLCYKRLVQETTITRQQQELYFGEELSLEGQNFVVYDRHEEELLLGCYGRFIPEDVVRRQEAILPQESNLFDEV